MISVFKKYNGEILYVFVFLKRAIMKLTQLYEYKSLLIHRHLKPFFYLTLSHHLLSILKIKQ